jgi:hypothetical protein
MSWILAFTLSMVSEDDLEGDGLARQCLHKDLHTAMKTEDEVGHRLLLDVIIGERTSIL